MILVFLGPPACGKGTQARRLAEARGLVQISTGDLLRDAVSRETKVGLEAKSYMDSGQLVPDQVVIGIFREALEAHRAAGRTGFVLDGFPRTVPQAEALEETLEDLGTSIAAVLDFQVDREAQIRRSAGRRVCTNKACQATYHVEFNPPRTEGVCDVCGHSLYQREDDRPEAVGSRLGEYERKTAPLLDHYRRSGKLEPVDSNRSIDEIARDLEARVDRLGGGR